MTTLSSRTGKIGRLSKAVRDELNQRIEDGEGAHAVGRLAQALIMEAAGKAKEDPAP